MILNTLLTIVVIFLYQRMEVRENNVGQRSKDIEEFIVKYGKRVREDV